MYVYTFIYIYIVSPEYLEYTNGFKKKQPELEYSKNMFFELFVETYSNQLLSLTADQFGIFYL